MPTATIVRTLKLKPKVHLISAVRWDGSEDTANKVIGEIHKDWVWMGSEHEDIWINLATIAKRVRKGDFIVTDEKNQKFPMSPEFMEQNYEVVEETFV